LDLRQGRIDFSMTNLKIEDVKQFDPSLLQAVASLLPQLTSSGRTMTAAELRAMIASPLTTLFIAKDEDKIVGMISLNVVQMPTGLRSYLEDLDPLTSAQGRRHHLSFFGLGFRLSDLP
jgi:hypothetical protein